MKSVCVVLALLASAYAQGIKIAAPAENSHIVATKKVLIDVERPVRPLQCAYLTPAIQATYRSGLQNSHTPSADVAVIIGLRSCEPSGDCDAIAESGALGTILHKGAYDPISRTGGGSLYQNYTVTVPDALGTGAALLSVAHFYAGGVSNSRNLERFWPSRGVIVANVVCVQVANSPTIDTAHVVVQIDSA